MSEFQTKLNSVPSGGFLTDRDKDKKPILDVRELGIDFGGLNLPKEKVIAAIEASGFDARIRPEALTLSDFAKIQQALA